MSAAIKQWIVLCLRLMQECENTREQLAQLRVLLMETQQRILEQSESESNSESENETPKPQWALRRSTYAQGEGRRYAGAKPQGQAWSAESSALESGGFLAHVIALSSLQIPLSITEAAEARAQAQCPSGAFGVFVTIRRDQPRRNYVHGCIGWWDDQYRATPPSDLYAELKRVGERALWDDSRNTGAGALRQQPNSRARLIHMLDASWCVELDFLMSPVWRVDPWRGRLLGESPQPMFNNHDFGLIVYAPQTGARATYLADVFDAAEPWTSISDDLMIKAGIEPSERGSVVFYAYRMVQFRQSLFGCLDPTFTADLWLPQLLTWWNAQYDTPSTGQAKEDIGGLAHQASLLHDLWEADARYGSRSSSSSALSPAARARMRNGVEWLAQQYEQQQRQQQPAQRASLRESALLLLVLHDLQVQPDLQRRLINDLYTSVSDKAGDGGPVLDHGRSLYALERTGGRTRLKTETLDREARRELVIPDGLSSDKVFAWKWETMFVARHGGPVAKARRLAEQILEESRQYVLYERQTNHVVAAFVGLCATLHAIPKTAANAAQVLAAVRARILQLFVAIAYRFDKHGFVRLQNTADTRLFLTGQVLQGLFLLDEYFLRHRRDRDERPSPASGGSSGATLVLSQDSGPKGKRTFDGQSKDEAQAEAKSPAGVSSRPSDLSPSSSASPHVAGVGDRFAMQGGFALPSILKRRRVAQERPSATMSPAMLSQLLLTARKSATLARMQLMSILDDRDTLQPPRRWRIFGTSGRQPGLDAFGRLGGAVYVATQDADSAKQANAADSLVWVTALTVPDDFISEAVRIIFAALSQAAAGVSISIKDFWVARAAHLQTFDSVFVDPLSLEERLSLLQSVRVPESHGRFLFIVTERIHYQTLQQRAEQSDRKPEQNLLTALEQKLTRMFQVRPLVNALRLNQVLLRLHPGPDGAPVVPDYDSPIDSRDVFLQTYDNVLPSAMPPPPNATVAAVMADVRLSVIALAMRKLALGTNLEVEQEYAGAVGLSVQQLRPTNIPDLAKQVTRLYFETSDSSIAIRELIYPFLAPRPTLVQDKWIIWASGFVGAGTYGGVYDVSPAGTPRKHNIHHVMKMSHVDYVEYEPSQRTSFRRKAVETLTRSLVMAELGFGPRIDDFWVAHLSPQFDRYQTVFRFDPGQIAPSEPIATKLRGKTQFCVVMEKVPGQTLFDWIVQRNTAPPSQLFLEVRRVAEALWAARIQHGDMRTTNIMVTAEYRADADTDATSKSLSSPLPALAEFKRVDTARGIGVAVPTISGKDEKKSDAVAMPRPQEGSLVFGPVKSAAAMAPVLSSAHNTQVTADRPFAVRFIDFDFASMHMGGVTQHMRNKDWQLLESTIHESVEHARRRHVEHERARQRIAARDKERQQRREAGPPPAVPQPPMARRLFAVRDGNAERKASGADPLVRPVAIPTHLGPDLRDRLRGRPDPGLVQERADADVDVDVAVEMRAALAAPAEASGYGGSAGAGRRAAAAGAAPLPGQEVEFDDENASETTSDEHGVAERVAMARASPIDADLRKSVRDALLNDYDLKTASLSLYAFFKTPTASLVQDKYLVFGDRPVYITPYSSAVFHVKLKASYRSAERVGEAKHRAAARASASSAAEFVVKMTRITGDVQTNPAMVAAERMAFALSMGQQVIGPYVYDMWMARHAGKTRGDDKAMFFTPLPERDREGFELMLREGDVYLFYVMDKLGGMDLATYLERPGAVLQPYMRKEIQRMLERMHSYHILHNNLQPSCIMVAEDDPDTPYCVIKLLNFDAATTSKPRPTQRQVKADDRGAFAVRE